jgi:hypothetical protein
MVSNTTGNKSATDVFGFGKTKSVFSWLVESYALPKSEGEAWQEDTTLGYVLVQMPPSARDLLANGSNRTRHPPELHLHTYYRQASPHPTHPVLFLLPWLAHALEKGVPLGPATKRFFQQSYALLSNPKSCYLHHESHTRGCLSQARVSYPQLLLPLHPPPIQESKSAKKRSDLPV